MEVEEEDKIASASEEYIWDDTLLIKAYDKSMKLTKGELAKRLAGETNKQQQQQNKKNANSTEATTTTIKNAASGDAVATTTSIVATEQIECQDEQQQLLQLQDEQNNDSKNLLDYKVGNYIRATYVDGVDYEARILSINEDKGTCTLKYVGYGNEQEIKMSDLVPSWGKRARRLQFVKSRKENEDVGGCSEDNDMNDAKSNTKKSKMRRSHNLSGNSSAHHQQQQFDTSFLPPPPPMPPMLNELNEDSENLSAMLMSWYMSGYYTGLYQGQKIARNKTKGKR